VDTACAWGCLTNVVGDHCGQLAPSGGGVMPGDLDASGLADTTLGAGTIDGDSGVIFSGAQQLPGVNYHLANGIAVFRFKSLKITGPISLVGIQPIALVSAGDLAVDDIVDAR